MLATDDGETGGDPPCWAHLFADAERADEIGEGNGEGESPPAASGGDDAVVVDPAVRGPRGDCPGPTSVRV